MVRLVASYCRNPDPVTWGQRLREKYGPPLGDKNCTLPERILKRVREILLAEGRSVGSLAPA